ncbi:MAG TPA: hypothetical protein VFB45_04680 [Pseudolabrys sp.]|nr:hypothetical protein [Pseudolabrys sp.]
MAKSHIKQVFDRVLNWPLEDQEKVARVVLELEGLRAGDDITDEEWTIINARSARRDLASDEEVSNLFRRYRNA